MFIKSLKNHKKNFILIFYWHALIIIETENLIGSHHTGISHLVGRDVLIPGSGKN
jgi:hypothetical protein